MICGYHYTSEANWEAIKQDGLIPYSGPGIPETCAPVVNRNDPVTWLYDCAKEGDELIGVLMDISLRHKTKRVVCLEVGYDYASSVKARMEEIEDPADTVKLTHTLNGSIYGHQCSMNFFLYHISPEDIELVGLWDFDNLIY
jgi:hypothetical protein